MIETVNTFKYLGLYLDSHLQFGPHIDQVVDKATAKLSLLYKTRWLFDQETALTLYKSLVTPHFDYGTVVYEVSPQYQLQRLQVIQNAAARMILLEEEYFPVYEMHEKLNIDMLATRRCKSMVKIIYTCLHDKEPSYLYDKLKPVNYGNRVTRVAASGVLEVPKTNAKYDQYAFGFRAPVQWNLTKVELKSAVNEIQKHSSKPAGEEYLAYISLKVDSLRRHSISSLLSA